MALEGCLYLCVVAIVCVCLFFCIYMYSLYLYEQLDNDKGDDDDEPVIDKSESREGMEEFCSKGHIETSNLQSSRPETTAMILWPDGDLRVMRIIVIADKILDLGL